MTTKNYLDVEDLEVSIKQYRLHIKVCDMTHTWPREKKYEFGENFGAEASGALAPMAYC